MANPMKKPTGGRMNKLDRMAGLGRMGDTELAHVTPGEMVVPRQVLARDPGLARHAAQAISSAGADPRQYVVGSPQNSRNPRTRKREYAMQEIAFDPAHYTQQYGNELAQAGVDVTDPTALWGYYNETGRDLGQTANVYEEGARDAGFSGNFAGNWGTDVAGTNYDPTSENYSGGNFELPSYYAAQNVDHDFKAGGRGGRKQDEGAGDIQGWWNNPGAKLDANGMQSAYNTKWTGDQFGMNSYDMSQIDAAMRNGTTFPTDRIANMTWADRSNFYHTFGYDPATRIDGGYYPIEGAPPGVMGGNINSVIGGSGVPQSFANIDMLARYSPTQLQTLARQWPTSTGNDPYSANMLDFLAGRQIQAPVYSGPANSGPGRPSGGYIGTFTHNYPGAGQDGNYLVRGTNGAATVKLDDLANGRVSLQSVQRALDTGANLPGGATMYSLHPADLANIDPNFKQFAQGTSGFGDEQYIFDDRLPTDYYTNPKSPGYYRSANAGENSQSMIDATPDMIQGGGFALYRHKDGTIVDGEGWKLNEVTLGNGQKGYFDTYYGVYRQANAAGTIVDQAGNPIITQYNQKYGPSGDPLKVYGSEPWKNAVGRDTAPNGEGGPRPYSVGPYGAQPTATGAAPTGTSSPFGTTPTGTAPTGTTPTTGTGVPQTGSGLPAGQENPYAYPYGYNPYGSPYGGINLNIFGGQQQTSGQTPATNTSTPSYPYSLLNAGYSMTPGGWPNYTSSYAADPNAQGGGIQQTAEPNSQNVEFRSPFGY